VAASYSLSDKEIKGMLYPSNNGDDEVPVLDWAYQNGMMTDFFRAAVPEGPLVRDAARSKTTDRAMAAGIQ
jgi:hypothetical protein